MVLEASSAETGEPRSGRHDSRRHAASRHWTGTAARRTVRDVRYSLTGSAVAYRSYRFTPDSMIPGYS